MEFCLDLNYIEFILIWNLFKLYYEKNKIIYYYIIKIFFK